MVPLQLMSISGKELHVSVLPLHVPERPFLGRGHPNGLGRGLRSLGLRGRLGRGSLSRLRGLGSRCWDGFFGRHRLRRLGLVFAPGGRPLRFGTGAGVGGSAGVGTVAGAGSGSGSAGSAGSAAAGSGSEATGGSALSAISFKDYFIGRSPRKSQRKRWSRGYLRRCRLHLSI